MRLLPVGSNLIFNDPSVTQGTQDLNVLDLFHYECHNNNHTLRYAILANTLSYIINVLHLSIMNYESWIMNHALCIVHCALRINYFINDKAGEGEAEDGCNVYEGAVHLFFLSIKFSAGLVGGVGVRGMNVGSGGFGQ